MADFCAGVIKFYFVIIKIRAPVKVDQGMGAVIIVNNNFIFVV